ncbi:MAG: hypothetical protein LLG00_10495 [Planctomycetaceae bacterium]|nr:hypothetical protein [Planctomycetaceae bacterium]
MQTHKIDFSCRCGRRLTAVIADKPSSIRFLDHGRRMSGNRCPTAGCAHDYSRLTAEEFKEHAFFGY